MSKHTLLILLFATFLYCDDSVQDSKYDKFAQKIASKLAQRNPSNYKIFVENATKKYGVNPKLAFAIIQIESAFNPYAISSTGALGLMQLKIDQAIPDVYRQVYGSDVPPSESFFEPELNIEVGVAYIWLMSYKYFANITNPISKEYCMIAGYNAGAGSVLRTFDLDKQKAQEIINSMTPEQVLYTLRTKLDSEQGRRYLVKVLNAKKQNEPVVFSQSDSNGEFIQSGSTN